VAATDSHIYAANLDGNTGSIYRYDIDGRNRTTVVSDVAWVSQLRRSENQLFWLQNAQRVQRHRDGSSGYEQLYENPSVSSLSQLNVRGNDVTVFNGTLGDFIIGDRLGGPASYHALYDASESYPSQSALTPSHLYYVHYTNASYVMYAVDLASGAQSYVDAAEYIGAPFAHDGAVFYAYRVGNTAGIRRVRAFEAPVDVAPTVPASQSYSNPIVDATGIYSNSYDGTSSRFYRIRHQNPGQRQVVSVLGPTTEVSITQDSFVYMNRCGRGPGNVLRLAKP
jgi:hypothetical protein